MITDSIALLRDKMTSKKRFRSHLLGNVKRAESGDYSRKARLLNRRIKALELKIQEIRTEQMYLLEREKKILADKPKYLRKAKEVAAQINVLQWAIGYAKQLPGETASSTNKRAKNRGLKARKVLRDEGKFARWTLKWLGRYMAAIRSKDKEQIERMAMQLAQGELNYK